MIEKTSIKSSGSFSNKENKVVKITRVTCQKHVKDVAISSYK